MKLQAHPIGSIVKHLLWLCYVMWKLKKKYNLIIVSKSYKETKALDQGNSFIQNKMFCSGRIFCRLC